MRMHFSQSWLPEMGRQPAPDDYDWARRM